MDKFDLTTVCEWTSDDARQALTVTLDADDCLTVLHEIPNGESQVLDLDEHGWKALYNMIGEVSK